VPYCNTALIKRVSAYARKTEEELWKAGMHEMVGYGMIALFIIFGLILWVASQPPGSNGLKDGRRPPG
jgi:hypothetical protein